MVIVSHDLYCSQVSDDPIKYWLPLFVLHFRGGGAVSVGWVAYSYVVNVSTSTVAVPEILAAVSSRAAV